VLVRQRTRKKSSRTSLRSPPPPLERPRKREAARLTNVLSISIYMVITTVLIAL